jgi:hypothetical protein
MNTQPEAIMGSDENTLKVGSNPCRTANNTNVFEGIGESRTDSAQKTAESETPKMKFPKVIRHRRSEVTIYGKKSNYPFYRIAYRVAGKRHLHNFSKYGEALKETESKVRELAEGSPTLTLR